MGERSIAGTAIRQLQELAESWAKQQQISHFYTVVRFAANGSHLEYWRIEELALARETFDVIRGELRPGEYAGLYGADDQVILWAEA